jgi:hypothetical protein
VYRFIEGEWKDRGVGDLKLLKDKVGMGLYTLHAVDPQRLKAPGFNP